MGGTEWGHHQQYHEQSGFDVWTVHGGCAGTGISRISQQVIKVSGTYATLSGLHHFVQAMPTGIELTGITIQNKRFIGKITVYGISA